MSKNKELLDYIKNSLTKYVNFISTKRFSLNMESKNFKTTDDVLSDYERLVGEVGDIVSVDLSSLKDYAKSSTDDYSEMLVAQLVGKGIEPDVVLGVREILEYLYTNLNIEQFDPNSMTNLELYCNLFLSNPKEFLAEIQKPIKGIITELETQEKGTVVGK